ncbi:MAG TPA: 2TM domain-containing protein, partial [Alphaproteobacteria bacterium]|nr:2TM domain-containing protein [Alphaproteobacteria bacterium]
MAANQHSRGTGSEPIEIAPGIGAREAAREAELEQWAWRRVKSLRLFYTHLSLFAIVNILLLLIDVSTPGDPWFYQVLLG